ncbi:MAG: RnfABCDGE type electron transport complex subunit C, partial [Candidatus Hydrogenedentes bacterium]|nr:RnfABCDGE type electron transport complex subunit C [Candidatus Hydrogenedentota bacterium]
VGIENNKPDAVEAMRRVQPANEPIEVESIETKYPQGAEKMLIKALLDREVPSGGLPLDVGVAVFNVATLAQVGELLPLQRGLIERVITVTGPAVSNPGNFLVALGTPIRFVLEQCGCHVEEPVEVILGGPMMGVAISSLDIPITKGVTGLLVLDKATIEERDFKEYPCIHCGKCVDACPIHLNPSRLGQLARKREYDTMANEFHLMDCFECGSCSYVCPSNIPLVQRFRVAKTVIRERNAAS